MKKANFFKRIIAAVLVLTTVLTFLPLNAIALDGLSAENVTESVGTTKKCNCGVSVLYNGAAHKVVTIEEHAKESFELFTLGEKPESISWQIRTPAADKWVNIYGMHGETIPVTYSLIGSMLNDEGAAFIRAEVKHSDGTSCFSEPVEVRVEYDTGETEEQESPRLLAPKRTAVSAAEDDEENFETFSIVINYIFDNGGLAFEPYGASVAKGSSFVRDVTSPKVVGYTPVRRVGTEYIDASVVSLNYTNITEDITINVIYEPAIVEYQVHHHLQDLYDDDYSVTPDHITYGEGLTGSIVPKGIELGEDVLPGFKALEYECLEIAADGSTVIEIRYERNYYLIDFDMQGGYGVEPVYIRYGSEVGANIPIRHGYVFNKWQLISYSGRTPTAEEASRLDINVSTIKTPNANLVYRAIWITQLAKYTMVFWRENAENTDFSYWGSLDDLTAMSGSLVSGSDRIREVAGIDDESAFTYMDAFTDKDVLVEGDGSTVINVYYARNRYALTFKAPGTCTIEVGHTHSDDCYVLLCPKESHVHGEECSPTLSCGIPEHTEHTDECIICGMQSHTHGNSCCATAEHTHSTACYNNIGNSSSAPAGAPETADNGYIFALATTNWWGGTTYTYYIYIAGGWYRYNGRNVSTGDIVVSRCGASEHTHGTADCPCNLPVHAHSDSCYSDVIHTHSNDCYTYDCNITGHQHSDGCYFLDCVTPVGHSHSSNCTRSNQTNTVKIEKRKYLENLEDSWPVRDDHGNVYNSGQRWTPSNSSTYSQVLVYIANMPAESFTLTLSESSNDTYTMKYYREVLEGEAYETTFNGKNFKHYITIVANYNYLTEAEDFFEQYGFYKFGSSHNFSSGKIDLNGGGTVSFYYGRIIDHYLKFRSNGDVINERTVHGLPYGASLKEFNFIPDYPESLEPNAYFFDGWYTTPGHYDGTEANWDALTMDEGDVMLYAKWSPISHSVKVYLDDSFTEQIGSEQHVSHGSFAKAPTETVKKGDYIFQGWFYKDGGEDKAFVFTGIPVNQDLKIFAKWSSHVTVNYTINYVLYDATGENRIVIADPTTGSSIAGKNKTFLAKAGSDLYKDYQTGYYPLTSSHTVTMSAENTNHTFTFEYVYVESMPYLVRYVDENGNKLVEDKKVLDNTLSVVTETFVKVAKKMPDAYQKRLVLSADKTDADGDGIYDANVIVFRYTTDEVHAYYRVVYYIETLHGSEYREYRSEDPVGVIGQPYSIIPMEMTGFSYNPENTKVNGEYYPTVDGAVTATLTSDGLLFEIYYDRVELGYTVKYLESGTNKELYEEKHGRGIFGEQIVENAPGLTHKGYRLVSEGVKQINLSTNVALNVIEFFYEESTYSIKYQKVGAPDGATLTMSSELINAVSGDPTGSRPIMLRGYHYEGWFLDSACTVPVPEGWVADDMTLTPVRDGVWLSDKTYYVKIAPDYTSLTVKTLGVADVDAGEIFIFRIQGVSAECSAVDLRVTVVGNSSVTVTNLPIGEYSVTEISSWSYRYTPDSENKVISISYVDESKNAVTFSHVRTNVKWLDGNDNKINKFN